MLAYERLDDAGSSGPRSRRRRAASSPVSPAWPGGASGDAGGAAGSPAMHDEHAGPVPPGTARLDLELLPCVKRPADPHLELEVPVEANAVDGLTDGLHHRRRDVEVVDLEDEVPGPRMAVRANL
jgi:hypothetical protein